MNPEEAIRELSEMQEGIKHHGLKGQHYWFRWIRSQGKDIFTTSIQALEKQIPKKPIKDRKQEIRYTSSYSCPSCGGGFIGTGIADYCYHCGQRMDWNVEEFEKEMLEMLEEE